MVDQALQKAGISATDLNAVAFTQGPGLMGSLLVGTSFAKSLAMSTKLPKPVWTSSGEATAETPLRQHQAYAQFPRRAKILLRACLIAKRTAHISDLAGGPRACLPAVQ